MIGVGIEDRVTSEDGFFYQNSQTELLVQLNFELIKLSKHFERLL